MLPYSPKSTRASELNPLHAISPCSPLRGGPDTSKYGSPEPLNLVRGSNSEHFLHVFPGQWQIRDTCKSPYLLAHRLVLQGGIAKSPFQVRGTRTPTFSGLLLDHVSSRVHSHQRLLPIERGLLCRSHGRGRTLQTSKWEKVTRHDDMPWGSK